MLSRILTTNEAVSVFFLKNVQGNEKNSFQLDVIVWCVILID